MTGDERNGELSRATILAAAGAALVAIPQQAPDLAGQPLVVQGMMIVGGLLVVAAVAVVLRALIRGRDKRADQ